MEKGSLDFKKSIWILTQKKNKNVLLSTHRWKILWGTKIGVSVASLWKPHYKTFIFKYG